MRSRVVRVTLTLLAIAVVGTAAYYYWTTLARVNASLQAAASFSNARIDATRAAFELRSVQQAYVAPGQNEAFWFERATSALDALRTALTTLERETTSGPARAALADVSAAADEFEARDRRVRSYASSGQKLLAADIIFSESLDVAARIIEGLDSAGTHAGSDAAAVRAAAVRQQMLALAIAGAAAILAVLLLSSTGASGNVSLQEAPITFDETRSAGLLNLELRPAVSAAKGPASIAQPGTDGTRALVSGARQAVTPPQPAHGAAASAPAASDRPVAVQTASASAIKLEDVAAVCADLARASDTNSIPAILERAASALDASGLVLWIADAEGRELLPIAAHGYSPGVLARMASVPADSQNATAGAFRTGLVQTVRGDGTTSGAIAAPLVSPAGPLGVLSLEMQQRGEGRPERLAAAAIIASQLATILGPAERSADRSIS
jgi:hypothetical protein